MNDIKNSFIDALSKLEEVRDNDDITCDICQVNQLCELLEKRTLCVLATQKILGERE